MKSSEIAKILQVVFKKTDIAGAMRIQHTLSCLSAEPKNEIGVFELSASARTASIKVSLGETTQHYTVDLIK